MLNRKNILFFLLILSITGFCYHVLCCIALSRVYCSTVFLIFGWIVGKFLNILVYFVPRKLEKEWLSYIENVSEDIAYQSDLLCSVCQVSVNSWHQLLCPKIYDLCAICSSNLNKYYPIIEFATACIFFITSWVFGCSIKCYIYLFFLSVLLILCFIDLDSLFLPDAITQPFIWMGLSVNFFSLLVPIQNAVAGAILGYISLYILSFIYQFIFDDEIIGAGDFKLLAGIGAWLGWQCIPWVICLSAGIGFLYYGLLFLHNQMHWNSPCPFGPSLVCAVYGMLIFNWL